MPPFQLFLKAALPAADGAGMDNPSARIPCPDRDPQRAFVHRITPSECERRQAANFHKCAGCLRSRNHRAAIDFRCLLAPRIRRAS